MPRLGGIGQADTSAVHRSAEMAGLEAELLPGVGVVGGYRDPGIAQQIHKGVFFALASGKQAQHAGLKAARLGPAERVPERPFAGLADLTSAQVRPQAIISPGRYGIFNRLKRGGGQLDVGAVADGGHAQAALFIQGIPAEPKPAGALAAGAACACGGMNAGAVANCAAL